MGLVAGFEGLGWEAVAVVVVSDVERAGDWCLLTTPIAAARWTGYSY